MQAEFQVESNLGELPYDGDGPYDLVTCMFALHYFFESESRLRMFLRNISNNLAPGGLAQPSAGWQPVLAPFACAALFLQARAACVPGGALFDPHSSLPIVGVDQKRSRALPRPSPALAENGFVQERSHTLPHRLTGGYFIGTMPEATRVLWHMGEEGRMVSPMLTLKKDWEVRLGGFGHAAVCGMGGALCSQVHPPWRLRPLCVQQGA